MRILLLHNTYQLKGGEDSVLENEYQLLLDNNNTVEKFIFDNDTIKSSSDKLMVGIRSIYNNSSSRILKQKIIEFKPDIIHVHNFFPIASPSIFYVANKMKIPIVMTLHNYRLICPNALLLRDGKICELCIDKAFPINGVIYSCYRKSRIQSFILAFMSFLHKKTKTWKTRVNKYITLTDFAKNKIINSSLGLKSSQIVVKPNFVDDNGFNYEKEDYFLFVGRLSEEKGIKLLLSAFKESKRKLLIIGSGPLEDIIIAKVKNNKNIEYLGFRNKSFIIDKLMKAKALVFSSIWYETFGMTIIEAFSTGTPVIGPNIGGPNEIIKEGTNGLIYKANNKSDLINKIHQIDSDKIEHKKLSEGARNSYENLYSPEKNYVKLMEIYKSVING